MRVGNYTLVQVLGRGGTSEVYAAQRVAGDAPAQRVAGDAAARHAVAVKLLRPQIALDPEARDAFVTEAVRTRELRHPNIVRVLDVGHDLESGSCYIVMERIEGETLAERLARVHRIDEPALRELAAAIADGMQAAHARGIVHRDLKPGNVMMRGDVPIIVDFGIAKSLGAKAAAHTERRVGTVAYMAPEQLTDGLITPAVDIWALGVMIYEAATGQLPFGNFNDGRLPQLFDTPARPSTLAPLSPAFERLIMRCLERDPGKRPATMAEVAQSLRAGDQQGASVADDRVTEDIGPTAMSSAAAGLASAGPASAGPVAAPGGLGQIGKYTVRTVSLRFLWITLLVAGIGIAGVALAVGLRHDDKQAQTPLPVVQPTTTPTDAALPLVEEAADQPPEVEHKRARPKPRSKPAATTRKTSQGETLD